MENAIKAIDDNNLSNNFVGVFPSDKMIKVIDYKQLINQKTGKYSFLISNTDNSTKCGEHWWSILNIEPKKNFFIHLVMTNHRQQKSVFCLCIITRGINPRSFALAKCLLLDQMIF